MSDLGWLAARAGDRIDHGVQRRLRSRQPDDGILDMGSNDYLGLSRHPDVIAGGVSALERWGAGSTGSRLVTGSTSLHAELEAGLAGFLGAESALVFSSGYVANLGAVTALAGPDVLIVSDAGNHASIVDACRLSRSRVVVTSHNDVAAVAAALAARTESRALVVVDSVFSVDGDLAPLGQLADVCGAAGAILLVDEAHGLGICGEGGRGLVDEHGLSGRADVVRTVTLSKSLGSQGGAVIGDGLVIDHLVNTARSFIFDTGLAPACAGSALAALGVLAAEPWRPATVLARSEELAAALGLDPSPSSVVSVVIGHNAGAERAAAGCLERGVRVGCFRPPSVPVGTSRLRLTARAVLTQDEVQRVASVVREAIRALPPEQRPGDRTAAQVL